ncbi:hypothetical protein [Wenxinia saemankumensis]|uniref:Uncharacterized protein n=1 Tax=Wenxinia saemankumensis TaxID=1447782 RepID=A0A1M6EM87_9RHOB|nr:hypothetical protein [Wenxinia saemankumensis]SHI86388.1 hypothetical protein SAMN05444417_2060 [Wenxinia saemankumensis]
MSPVLIVATGIVFAAWAVTAFRVLFDLRRRGQRRTGRALNGPGTFLVAARDWAHDPAARRPRLWLGGLTLLLAILASVPLAGT